MSISRNSYKKIQKAEDSFEVRWEQNTIVNVGQKHIALFRKGSNESAVVELPPFPARYVNFDDVEKAGKFESEDSKKKFHVHFKTGTPSNLSLNDDQKKNMVSEQNAAVQVLQDIDDLCYEAMWKAPILKKKKDTIRRALKKNGASGSELERMAVEMFKDQGQSGVVLAEDGTFDIKTRMNAFKRVGADDLVLRRPHLIHRALDGSVKQVMFKGFSEDGEGETINRDALIAAQVRIKPYVTPNGAYGTTYSYVGGLLISNGPAYGDKMEFSNYDSLLGAVADGSAAPPCKRQKVN